MTTTAASTDGAASETFEAVYRTHYPAMMRLGYLLTGSNELAEDLVHDVFLRAQARMPLDHPGSYLGRRSSMPAGPIIGGPRWLVVMRRRLRPW